VVRSKRHMWLYDGEKVIFSAPVAIGTPGHPTPLGTWKVVGKVKNPSWTNPGAAWAASMPPYIPPGPSNPLGTRAIYLSASGIRFHGTNNINSVGTAASHGCMRMYRSDIEALYPKVPVGIDVFILR
jgi:lipoprotein-anchoring transpeptidase ErfK/SrfK